ncbi:MAG: A/G-specific adenine glycosylase [Terriglobia bacterium]
MLQQRPPTGTLQKRLLRWFDRNQRTLPWRGRRHSYRVWLAEIMLQQTRVPVAIPYYRRFLRAFPTVQKLARGRLEQVLRLWAGLGYYQRARHLHQAAKKITREHGGQFPSSLAAALALPGVGPYVARAVLSIAYRKPLAVVDGNVPRVLARLFRLSRADVSDRGAWQPLADRLVARRRPGDFNQALMELGSTICLPRIPRCRVCPLEAICAARQAGLERRIPRRRPKPPRPRLTLCVLVVRRRRRLLVMREPRGLFSGLWHFPYTREKSPHNLTRALGVNAARPVARLTHETTMRDLILQIYEAHTGRNGVSGLGGRIRWVRPEQMDRLAVGAATRKIAATLAG